MVRQKKRSAIQTEIVMLKARLAALRQQQGEQPAAAEPAASDAKAIQGTWEVVSSTLNLIKVLPGEEGIAPEKVVKTTKIVITGDTLKVMGDHVITMAFEYKINPAAKPKMIDLKTAGDMGLISWGIYKLEGDQLTICASGIPSRDASSQPGDSSLPIRSRPTEFWADLGSGKDLLVLRRIGDAVVSQDEKDIEGAWEIESVSQYNDIFQNVRFGITGPVVAGRRKRTKQVVFSRRA